MVGFAPALPTLRLTIFDLCITMSAFAKEPESLPLVGKGYIRRGLRGNYAKGKRYCSSKKCAYGV